MFDLELETKAIRRFAKVSIVSYSRPTLMIIASQTQFHVERPWGQRPFSIVSYSVLNVKAVVAACNQEKALVGAFSVITNLRMELFQALDNSQCRLILNTAQHTLHTSSLCTRHTAGMVSGLLM